MAYPARTLTKALPRSSVFPASSIRLASRTSKTSPKQFLQAPRRQYSSAPTPSKSNTTHIAGGIAAAALLTSGFYLYNIEAHDPNHDLRELHLKKGSAGQSIGLFTPTNDDYQKVYNAIAKLL